MRLLFHHYRDVEAIYEAAFECLNRRYWDRVVDIAPDLLVGDRVQRTVEERARLFEAVAPLRRAASSVPSRRTSIADAVADGDRRLRACLERTFGPELASAGKARPGRLHAMELVTSCEAWDRLRRVQGLSALAAGRVMATCLEALMISDGPIQR
ncbi:MAG: hypothetical protein ACRDYZ_06065 [Acidimicrobiales bacterium]